MNESQTITKKYSEIDKSDMKMNSLRRSQQYESSHTSGGSLSVADRLSNFIVKRNKEIKEKQSTKNHSSLSSEQFTVKHF